MWEKKKEKNCNIMTLENFQCVVLCGPPLGLAGRLILNVTSSWRQKLVSLGPREWGAEALSSPKIRNTYFSGCVLIRFSRVRDPMECSPPGSPVHEILQARIPSGLPFSPPEMEPTSLVSPALAAGFFTHWDKDWQNCKTRGLMLFKHWT